MRRARRPVSQNHFEFQYKIRKYALTMFLLCSSPGSAGGNMDWDRAIALNHSALTRIVAALLALVRLTAGGALDRLPRPVYRAALKVLRPAESALRRLIILAARGVEVKLRKVC